MLRFKYLVVQFLLAAAQGQPGILGLLVSDVTEILQTAGEGGGHALEKLLPLVYDELRILAAARMRNVG